MLKICFLSICLILQVDAYNGRPGNKACLKSTTQQTTDLCEQARAGAHSMSLFAKDSIFASGLNTIRTAFAADRREHAISFGRDTNDKIFCSAMNNGGPMNGMVPRISGAFADLHNHPKNIPPDAGDLYGLIDLNKNNRGYTARFIVTANGTLYCLLVTDTAEAAAFNANYPRQAPAIRDGSPAFPSNIVDEFREMKYGHHCTDEMAMSFILEKYRAGVVLLKQSADGLFAVLRTIVSGDKDHLSFSAGACF